MCEPTTILAISAAVVSAYSSVQQGKAAEATGNYNARELENQATAIRNKGAEEENIKRRQIAEFAAKQRAMLGASGIDIDTGSAGDLQQDTQLLGEVDALRIRRNFADQADTAERQGVLVKAEGRAAKRAGNLKAVGTLLTTAATLGASGAFSGAGAAGVGGSASSASAAQGVTLTPMSQTWYTPNSAYFI